MTAAFKIGDRIPLKAYAGIDVGKTVFDYYIIEPFHILGDDELHSQDHAFKDVRVNRSEIRKCIETCRRFKIKEVIIESTGIYHVPFAEEFTNAGGFDVRVVPAHKAKDPSGSDKSDEGDAEHLAKLSVFQRVSKNGKHTIKPSYIPQDPVEKALRKIDRMRTKLTNDLTKVKNRIHKILGSKALSLSSHEAGNISFLWTRLVLRGVTEDCMNYDDLMAYLNERDDVLTRTMSTLRRKTAIVNAYLSQCYDYLEDVDKFLLREMLDIYDTMSTTIKRFEEQMIYLKPKMPEHLEVQYEVAVRNTGVDKITGITLAIESGEMRRFTNRQSASSYTGLRPRNESSGGKKPRRRNQTKNGSKHLRRVLYIIAQSAKKKDDHWKNTYKVFKEIKQRTAKQSNCIIARKFYVKYYRQVMDEHERRRRKLQSNLIT